MVLAKGAAEVAVREEDGARAAAAGDHRLLTVVGVPGGDDRIGAGRALTELAPSVDMARPWADRAVCEQPIELFDSFVELATPRQFHVTGSPC